MTPALTNARGDSAMPQQAIAEVTRISESRMLGDGLHWPDIREIVARADQWDSWRNWYEAFAQVGDRYERLAEKALRAGHRISAGELLWRSSMHYHYAQFNAFDEPDLREAGQKRKAALYQRAASYFRPAAERVEIRFEEFVIPGYLRLPLATQRPPCVLLIGGLESTKEESFLFENLCLGSRARDLRVRWPWAGRDVLPM
jgi:2,6-dihydroxypseudooxynicotine hydrolase